MWLIPKFTLSQVHFSIFQSIVFTFWILSLSWTLVLILVSYLKDLFIFREYIVFYFGDLCYGSNYGLFWWLFCFIFNNKVKIFVIKICRLPDFVAFAPLIFFDFYLGIELRSRILATFNCWAACVVCLSLCVLCMLTFQFEFHWFIPCILSFSSCYIQFIFVFCS